jgi:hypothetical protein
MRIDRKYIPLISGILYVGIATGIMLILGKTGWMGAYQECYLYNACHCEEFRYDRWVLQPTNTWSNYFFVFFGLGMLGILTRDPPIRILKRTGQYAEYKSDQNFMLGNTLFSVVYAFVVITCGLTSAYFHASMRNWANALDVIAMNMFITFLPIYTLTKMTTRPEKWFLLIYFPGNILFTLARVFLFETYLRLLVFNVFLGVAVLLELYIYGHRKYGWKAPGWFPLIYRKSLYLFLGMITFGIGYIIWNLWQDGGVFCNPAGIFQGHAVWHFTCALTTWFVFLYLRSEKPIQNVQPNL